MRRGKFIVFEGLDGSGKTTQINGIKNEFYSRRKQLHDVGVHGLPKKCLLEREPDDGLIGSICRGAIKGTVILQPETQAMMQAAARFEHIKTRILPNLERGNHVFCDRFYFSNFAYNTTPSLTVEDIIAMNKPGMDIILPDATVFIDISPETAARRMEAERVEKELFEALEYQKKVKENYGYAMELLAKRENIFIVNGENDEDTVRADIWKYLSENVFTNEDYFS